jgi:hypothetical protein
LGTFWLKIEQFWPFDGHQAKNRKKGDEIKKKSSPLKLLNQSQPNFAEMILRWSLDLYMLSMFAVSTYHLSVIVFEIKDEKY